MFSRNRYRHIMREPDSRVEFVASDFEFSNPVTGEATVTNILWIVWNRVFGTRKMGVVNSRYDLPVIGMFIYDPGINSALYDMVQKNPGYDVIFYPQIESYRYAPILGSGIYSKTTYKVTARLGKLRQPCPQQDSDSPSPYNS